MSIGKYNKTEHIGQALRDAIKQHKDMTGRTYRHLSVAIGREGNYIASYLFQPVNKWAIPKHPTYGMLLSELGLTEAKLLSEDTSPEVPDQ